MLLTASRHYPYTVLLVLGLQLCSTVCGLGSNNNAEISSHVFIDQNGRQRMMRRDGMEERTDAPTEAPTDGATEAPTEAPTDGATEAPTEAPTDGATEAPTEAPTVGATAGAKISCSTWAHKCPTGERLKSGPPECDGECDAQICCETNPAGDVADVPPAVIADEAELWPPWGADQTRCGGAVRPDVGSSTGCGTKPGNQKACQKEAASASAKYYEYDEDSGCCSTCSDSDIAAAAPAPAAPANKWKIYSKETDPDDPDCTKWADDAKLIPDADPDGQALYDQVMAIPECWKRYAEYMKLKADPKASESTAHKVTHSNETVATESPRPMDSTCPASVSAPLIGDSEIMCPTDFDCTRKRLESDAGRDWSTVPHNLACCCREQLGNDFKSCWICTCVDKCSGARPNDPIDEIDR